MQKLIDSLKSMQVLPKEELDFFNNSLVKSQCKAGEYLLRPDEDASRLFIVNEGILKIYLINRDGKNIVKGFAKEGEIAMDAVGFFKKVDSHLFIQALTDCKYYIRPANLSQDLYKRHMAWFAVDLELLQMLLTNLSQRETDFLYLTGKEKYQKILKIFNSDIDRIPQKDIASYLGVTPESLSRIIRNLAAESSVN